jgi:cell division protein FtsZ
MHEQTKGAQMERVFDILDIGAKTNATIKVMGIGGGGGNAINNMISAGLDGVEFIAANTDFQVLEQNMAPQKLQLGANSTRGLGAGGNPEVGAKATQEDIDRIRDALQGCDMVFITAGLGGGTGTGGAPIVAQVCRELGVLTVAVVTKPFGFEGKVRMRKADDGVKALRQVVDTLITIPNDRLSSLADRRATLLDMFKRADDVLLYAVKGISDLIMKPGLINVDFADVRTVMGEMGLALMGTGIAKGENRAVQAAQQAISSPLLEDISINGARAALINISAGPELGMHEFEEASSIIFKEVHDEAQIILGTAIDPSLEDELRVTVIATGIGKEDLRAETEPRHRSIRVVGGTGFAGELDYDYLGIPSIIRQNEQMAGYETRQEAGEKPMGKKKGFFKRFAGTGREDEDLNIPTFIRRQAD